MWPAWLGEETATVPDLKAMLAPYPFRRHGLLAGEPARRQREEQRRKPDRPDSGGVGSRATELPLQCE
jgi:hypothetical protein